MVRISRASTITQQVAKNFLLTNEVSLNRKIKEAILAFRIERALSKERILELYLNQIYLGEGTYGVASASLEYFDKPISELSYEEAAMLAALPKAQGRMRILELDLATLAFSSLTGETKQTLILELNVRLLGAEDSDC